MTNKAAVHQAGAEHSVRLDVAVLFPLKSPADFKRAKEIIRTK